MSGALAFILEKLGIQTRSRFREQGYLDAMEYIRGVEDAANQLGFDMIAVPDSLLALPKPEAKDEVVIDVTPERPKVAKGKKK